MEMEIQNERHDDQGVFYAEAEGMRIGSLSYSLRHNDRLIMEHTEVSGKFAGHGIGKRLVDHAVQYARENRMKIIPLCPFAKSVFKRFPGYEDVI